MWVSSVSVHRFDSLIRFTALIPYFDSLIRLIESVHWFDSLIRFIDSIHWFDSLIRFFGSILWFDSNIQEPMGPPGIFIGFKMWKTIGFIACSFPKGWKTSVWSILKCQTIIIVGFFWFFCKTSCIFNENPCAKTQKTQKSGETICFTVAKCCLL